MIVQPFPKTSERLKGKGIRHKNGPFKKISVCLTDINQIRSPLGSLRSLFPTISAGGQGFSHCFLPSQWEAKAFPEGFVWKRTIEVAFVYRSEPH